MSEFEVKHEATTAEGALQAAARLEQIIGEIMNGKRRADRIPVEEIIHLIQYCRNSIGESA